MSNKMLYGKNLDQYNDLDIDELLSKLTEDEINELNGDVDPDDSLLPPSQRCKDQTKKAPTGLFDREKLIKFLIEKAKKEPDWSHLIPFEHKVRGKVFVKPESQQVSNEELSDLGFDTEFDDEIGEILANSTEEQLVELAAVLGFTGMLNQIQYHAGLDNKSGEEIGGFNGVAKSDKLKVFDELPPNDTNVQESIEKLEANIKELTVLNLNNIKDIPTEDLKRLANALLKNDQLKELHMASTDLTNSSFEPFLEVLRINATLEVVNFESNFLTGDILIKIVEAIQKDSSKITEIHLTNQSQKTLGVQVEDTISKLIRENPRIVRFGLDFETLEAKVKMREFLRDNMDKNTRLERIK